MTRRYTLDRALASLIGAGLWRRRKGGVAIRDYKKFNPSRRQVLEKRRQTAERVAKWRDNQQKQGNARRNSVTPKSSNAAPLPAPKAGGNGAAPLGAPLPLDD